MLLIVVLLPPFHRSLLYGALFEKPKPISTQKGKSSHQQKTCKLLLNKKNVCLETLPFFSFPTLKIFLITSVRVKVARCSVDHQMFTSLIEKMELFKQDMMQSLLKREHQESFTRRKINKDPATVAIMSGNMSSLIIKMTTTDLYYCVM